MLNGLSAKFCMFYAKVFKSPQLVLNKIYYWKKYMDKHYIVKNGIAMPISVDKLYRCLSSRAAGIENIKSTINIFIFIIMIKYTSFVSYKS